MTSHSEFMIEYNRTRLIYHSIRLRMDEVYICKNFTGTSCVF